MESDLVLVIVVATALAFDFTNGFHDTARDGRGDLERQEGADEVQHRRQADREARAPPTQLRPGSTRATEAQRQGRGGSATAFGAVAVVAFLLFAAGVAFGVWVILDK